MRDDCTKMELSISLLKDYMINEVQALADLTIGKGLVSQTEIQLAINNDLAYVLQKNDDSSVIGFSLNEKINQKILKSLINICTESHKISCILDQEKEDIINFTAFGIMPQYQGHGYGRLLFQTIISDFQAKYDYISALAWKKGDIVPMKKLLTGAGFNYIGLIKSPYKEVKGIYCDYCQSDVCVCDSCLYLWKQ